MPPRVDASRASAGRCGRTRPGTAAGQPACGAGRAPRPKIERGSVFRAKRPRPVGHHMRMTDSGTENLAGTADTDTMEPESAQALLPAVPYGEWPSPISAAEIAGGESRGAFPVIIGSDTWWQQGLPDEGGRTTIMHSSGGKQSTLLPAPWSARTRVHEYGGQSLLPRA